MAEKLNPKVAMEMTIAQLADYLKWSPQVLEYFLSFRKPPLDDQNWDKRDNPDKFKQFCEDGLCMTLREFVRSLEDRGINGGWQTLKMRLKEIGLTRLETLLMQRSTVTFDMLVKIPRGKLLKMDAGHLGSMSDTLLCHLCRDGEPRLTVADLLALEPSYLRRWREFSLAPTITLLEKLGFGPGDGPFMSKDDDPREILVKDLIAKDGLTAHEAKKFVDIAARRNWI